MTKPASTKLPWYPWCPRDFASDPAVIQMSDMEELLYRRLLDYQFLAGTVPDDVPSLAKAARMSVVTVRRLWTCVSEQFPDDGNGRQNRRMERQRSATENHRQSKREAGRTGNEKRWAVRPVCDTSAIPESIANHRYTDTETDTETTKERTARTAFIGRFPPEYQPAMEGAFRASHNPDALLASLRAIESGLTPPATPLPVIGQAIHEMAVSGARMSVVTLRAFCRKIVAPAAPQGRGGPSVKPSPSELVFLAAAELDRREVAA